VARKTEPLLTRVARGVQMAPDELKSFLDEMRPECLIWKGHTKKGKPYLKNHSNPARILFAHVAKVSKLDEFVRLYNDCGEQQCINPWHHRPHSCKSIRFERYGYVPPLPMAGGDSFNEEYVLDILDNLRRGVSPDFLCIAAPSEEDFDEALRRYRLFS
jgi:hypothetical protein